MEISNLNILEFYDIPLLFLFSIDEKVNAIALNVDIIGGKARYLALEITNKEYNDIENKDIDGLTFFKNYKKYMNRKWLYLDTVSNEKFNAYYVDKIDTSYVNFTNLS